MENNVPVSNIKILKCKVCQFNKIIYFKLDWRILYVIFNCLKQQTTNYHKADSHKRENGIFDEIALCK